MPIDKKVFLGGLDKDKDGFVTKDEFMSSASERRKPRKDAGGEPRPKEADKPVTKDSTPAIAPKAAAFFESKIRPILSRACFSCHSDRSSKVKGGLKVDSRGALLAGGHGGPHACQCTVTCGSGCKGGCFFHCPGGNRNLRC